MVIHRIDGLENAGSTNARFGIVIHRIDGLETLLTICRLRYPVIHRIDGLESEGIHTVKIINVIHRIDGLEIWAFLFYKEFKCYPSYRWFRKCCVIGRTV